jgi:hypothetical protein
LISVRRVAEFAVALSVVALAYNGSLAQEGKKPFEAVPGMPGKDSVWVPTPFITLEKMYDLAKLTPKDFVMDLGSGDGRAIIVAAKRGTPGLGIEWNQDLIDLSNKLAAEAGVSKLAKFERGDMFAADLSKASVLGLFMLPDQLKKLTPKFLAMRPGSRITVNGFGIPGWTIDVTEKATGDCGTELPDADWDAHGRRQERAAGERPAQWQRDHFYGRRHDIPRPGERHCHERRHQRQALVSNEEIAPQKERLEVVASWSPLAARLRT